MWLLRNFDKFENDPDDVIRVILDLGLETTTFNRKSALQTGDTEFDVGFC